MHLFEAEALGLRKDTPNPAGQTIFRLKRLVDRMNHRTQTWTPRCAPALSTGVSHFSGKTVPGYEEKPDCRTLCLLRKQPVKRVEKSLSAGSGGDFTNNLTLCLAKVKPDFSLFPFFLHMGGEKLRLTRNRLSGNSVSEVLRIPGRFFPMDQTTSGGCITATFSRVFSAGKKCMSRA